jgi:hypothetical protein
MLTWSTYIYFNMGIQCFLILKIINKFSSHTFISIIMGGYMLTCSTYIYFNMGIQCFLILKIINKFSSPTFISIIMGGYMLTWSTNWWLLWYMIYFGMQLLTQLLWKIPSHPKSVYIPHAPAYLPAQASVPTHFSPIQSEYKAVGQHKLALCTFYGICWFLFNDVALCCTACNTLNCSTLVNWLIGFC